MKRRVWRSSPGDRPRRPSLHSMFYFLLYRLGRARCILLLCIGLAIMSSYGKMLARDGLGLGFGPIEGLERHWGRRRGSSAAQSKGRSNQLLDAMQADGRGGAAAQHGMNVEERVVLDAGGNGIAGQRQRGNKSQSGDAESRISTSRRKSSQQASLAFLQNGSFSVPDDYDHAPLVGQRLRKGGTKGGTISAQFLFLILGCLLFGSYLLYCLCCGGISARSLIFLKQPVMSMGGRVFTGVHVAEAVATAWCIGCILAADLLHWTLIAPLTCCVGFSCSSASWIFVHAMPSFYLHLTFLYNWGMCVVYTRPEDAYTDEQRKRIREMYASNEQQLDGDSEHWSCVGSIYESQLRGTIAGPRKRGRLGTDGNIDRGHVCSTCRAFVVRSDHHCPFLATCIGAHNQTYFMALMIQMMLSMWYGAAVSIHASYRCLSQRHKAEDCGTVLYVALAVVFVGMAITLFTSTTWFLCSVDVTIREALTMDFMRFKVGPCFVWSKISRQADRKKNLHGILGGNLFKLLVPFTKRPASTLFTLRLPEDDELEVQGVWWPAHGCTELASP